MPGRYTPWDRDLPYQRQSELFTTYLLEDTASVIRQLFDSLAEVETIRVCVRDPSEPHRPLIEGTISRAGLPQVRDCRSAAMSLKLLGACYTVRDGCLQPLR
jgi:hypothetical protein